MIDLSQGADSATIGQALADYYLHTAGNATPARVGPLLAYLGRVTRLAEVQMGKSPGAFIEHAQLRGDMRKWKTRLEAYRLEVGRLYKLGPDEPSEALAANVVFPIVAGLYPGEGDIRRAPDHSTPLGILSAAGGVESLYTAELAELGEEMARRAAYPYTKAKEAVAGAVDLIPWLKGLMVGVAGLAAYQAYRDFTRE